ncbi:MAG: replication-associated recombination protein A [Ignavibacteriales bacterium]|nr:replication-associated recombination protein A [Ignavibacteriales bacterium]
MKNIPLAERVRPQTLDQFVGQSHLLADGKPLRLMVEKDELRSFILWGPPGVGKTTLARIIANQTKSEFFALNAVSSGVKDVREVIAQAEEFQRAFKKTIMFIDEIHRFNKAQQDALLHSVEKGTITLIGATTENPSFEVISPLLSRMRVFVMEPMGKAELEQILNQAVEQDEIITKDSLEIDDKDYFYLLSGGDARKLLNGLEIAFQISTPDAQGIRHLTKEILEEAFQRRYSLYDKKGEQHYDIISAFIKSMRGSDPDAAVYWLARMLEGGEDPKFIARRMIILASEDIGNADPVALMLAVDSFTAVDYVGMPEAQIILSHVASYLASAPKSNAAVAAIGEAMEDVKRLPNLPVPLHLRNAPTKLMKELNYGKEYKYAHDYDKNFIEQQNLPDQLKNKIYYEPTENGREKQIKERLESLWKKRKK